jgi:glycosyltransferase involved in cell wall biosynthesis
MIHLRERFPRAKVYFVGGGRNKEEFISLSQELGVSDHCVFMGSVQHSKVLSLMASASLTVCPSRMDNLPATVIESLSVGTPVVATNAGGIPDIFDHGVEGFLVPPGDPKVLADSIAELLNSDDKRTEMSKVARNRFLSQFEQRAGVRAQADWFEEIMSAH